jgi:plastocyanin
VTPWACLTATLFRPSDCPPVRLALPSVTSAAATAPAPPSGLTSTVTGSTVQLFWTAPAGGDAAASYVIEAGSTAGSSNIIVFDTLSTAVTFTATSVPAATYFVRVKARNSAGTSGASNETVIVVGGSACVTAPGAPTGLTGSATGSSVTISWTAPAGGCAPAGYVIEAGSATGLSNLANFNTGSTATTFSASGVGAGTYFVRVRAANAIGSSAASNEITITVSNTPTPPPPPPGPCTVPGSPQNLTASLSGSTVTLTWTAASGSPTSYVVEVVSSSGVIATTEFGSTATQSTVTLNVAGTYTIRVKAKNACGTGNPSNEVTVTITAPCTVPSAPTGLTATVNGSSIFISWNAAGGAPTSYVVEIGTSSGASNIAASDTGNAATSATTGTLSPGTYFIRVRAKSACGTSDVSNQVSATIAAAPAPAVVTITASGVSPKNLTVSPGTQVTFVNNHSRNHNMASNPHPEHTDCTELNQVGFLTPGQSRQSGNLNTPKTCGYHDHDDALNSAFQGTITISN